MLLLPLAAGVVLVRDERWLEGAFAQSAPYLFSARGPTVPLEADAEEFDHTPPRRWDQGTRSFQCSRRADALKLWVALQRYGADGLGALYARLCALTARLHARLADHPDFEILHAPESNILCFRRSARSWRDVDPTDAEAIDRGASVAPNALQRIRARGGSRPPCWAENACSA